MGGLLRGFDPTQLDMLKSSRNFHHKSFELSLIEWNFFLFAEIVVNLS